MALTKTPIELSSTPSIVDGGNATAITIDSSERVGIQTSSPATVLHITGANDNTHGQVKISASGGAGADAQIAFATNSNGRGIYLDDNDTNKMKFYTGFGKGAAGTEITFDNNANVGIKTTSPTSNLHIGASGADAKREIRIDGTNGSSETYGFIIQADGENGRATFKVGQGGGTPAQELMIHPDGGICFNTDTATANALDDYEEGTWTPVLKGYYGNTGLTATQGSVSGYYTKIGRLVNIRIHFDSAGIAASGNSDIVAIGGLPFTATNGYEGSGPFIANAVNLTQSHANWNIIGASEIAMIGNNGSGGGWAWQTGVCFATSGVALRISMTYATAT